MIDLNQVESYRENNRIEAKKALGGLPHSIWETYSAFANTLGGVILLGVEEYRDKTFHTVNLPDPERLKQEFWDGLNDPKMASVNLLSSRDVSIETVNGDRIIVINVPKADRTCKPVYVEGNPLNTYRRNGEGDYKCTKEEFQAMVRDASIRSMDMTVLDEFSVEAIDPVSVREYRECLHISRPGLVPESLDDKDFLMKIGAVGIGEDGERHPTSGGLLMFGREYDIVHVFPNYFLDYREEYDEQTGWTDRLISSSGDWSGNLLDFYFRVCGKLQFDSECDDAVLQMAVREAFTNCLVNADYCGRGGILVEKRKDQIRFSNPGNFRINVNAAISGGLSDPRNSVIMKLFNLLDVGERAGKGIPNIFRVWKEHKLPEPEIRQSANPDRTDFLLPLQPMDSEMPAGKSRKKTDLAVKRVKRQMVIDYLTEHREASTNKLAKYLNLSTSNTREYIRNLIRDGIVIAVGNSRSRVYRLKS